MSAEREALLRAAEALDRIARWHGEFPPSGVAKLDGKPMSYQAAFGSNGARDYMRQVAADAAGAVRTALAAKPAQPEPSAEARDERVAFEAWVRSGHVMAGQFLNYAWRAWQARAALAAQKGGAA